MASAKSKQRSQVPAGHDDSVDCWCCPDVVQACPDCIGKTDAEATDCVGCDGRRWVTVFNEDTPKIVVHR